MESQEDGVLAKIIVCLEILYTNMCSNPFTGTRWRETSSVRTTSAANAACGELAGGVCGTVVWSFVSADVTCSVLTVGPSFSATLRRVFFLLLGVVSLFLLFDLLFLVTSAMATGAGVAARERVAERVVGIITLRIR